jgi:hypothetical protein
MWRHPTLPAGIGRPGSGVDPSFRNTACRVRARLTQADVRAFAHGSFGWAAVFGGVSLLSIAYDTFHCPSSLKITTYLRVSSVA